MYIRHFLVWAMEREHIEMHPLYGVRPPRAGMSRDRVLTDEEVRHFWRVSGECGDLARLALLTAQRQQSLAHMQWRHLDLERGLWSVPADNMKSGKPHVVPLSASAIEILNNRKRLDGPYVFGVGSNGERPFNGFSNGMESLRKTVVREPNQKGKRLSAAYKVDRRKRALERRETQWRFHDLRRSAVTFAQRAGASLDAVKALTQHKTAGVIGIYARHAFTSEKRTVATLIEQEVLAILRGETREEDSGMIEKIPQPN